MQRLEMAGIVVDSNVDRMRELEELATLACEENERLKGELDTALRELEGARRELAQVRGQVVTPFARSPFAPAVSPFAPAVSPFAPSPFAADATLDDDLGYPPKSSGKGARYFFLVAIVGAGIAALCVLRPWDRPRAAPIVAEQPAPPPPPVVTAPPAPKIAPTVPSVAPTIPSVAPTVPKVAATIPKAAPIAAREPRATKLRAQHKHAKHHAAKKHASAKSKESALDTSDPLGGTGL
jgi:hypothetical protein